MADNQGSMSVEEAGRMGGKKTASTHDMSQIGRQGGQARAKRRKSDSSSSES